MCMTLYRVVIKQQQADHWQKDPPCNLTVSVTVMGFSTITLINLLH